MFRTFSDGKIHISVVQPMVLSDICCIALLLTLPGKANVDVPGPFRTGKHLEELQSGRGPEASKKNSKRVGPCCCPALYRSTKDLPNQRMCRLSIACLCVHPKPRLHVKYVHPSQTP